MWIKILCIEYILWGIPTIESTFDVANMVKTATVKDVPINNKTASFQKEAMRTQVALYFFYEVKFV